MYSIPFFVLILCCFVNQSVSDSRATEAALICSNNTASPAERQSFVTNFLDSMDAITPLIARNQYAAIVNGSGNSSVFAFGECLKDLNPSECDFCFAQMKTQILRCLPFQLATRGGRLFFDGCYIRYDSYNFFVEPLTPLDKLVCGKSNYSGDNSIFSANALKLAENLSLEAPKNHGFAVGLVNSRNVSVYGLAQCWKFVRGEPCANCLKDAALKIRSCTPNDEGRVLNAGCYFRYSTQKFYFNSTSTSSGDGNGKNLLAIILASISAAVATLLTVATILFCARKKVVKSRRERKQLGPLVAIVNKSKLNFSYETLEKATNYFDESNKLGQGGSGSVYKGTLPDGRVVAIKRLFFNTRQWVDHFFNEVNLISDIKHKNLVGMLGCSITGPESLLVYEYVPNQSLHDYLFGNNNNNPPLSWESRFKIVLGTAEGLAYLHEESKVKIIHRDIKLSNILLDNDFTPKIADFGLARLLPEDKTHISTAIAGTLGYMAPEYVVRGKLSEKADVYSFGVFAIEVISGRRNGYFFQDSMSILQLVWNLYREDKLCEAVDPVLGSDYRPEAVSRLLQIGLVCVQASADLRPSMSMVVKMLKEYSEIPQPRQPPFLHPSNGDIKSGVHLDNYRAIVDSNTQSSGNSMTQSIIEPR